MAGKELAAKAKKKRKGTERKGTERKRNNNDGKAERSKDGNGN
jgi:hypothetical protein